MQYIAYFLGLMTGDNRLSLKHALLVLLEREPSSGYDIRKRFSEHMGYFWNASHQQIYQQLKVLHSHDEITCVLEPQEDKPDKKIYSITDKGRQSLKLWLAEKSKPNKVNDALLVKLYAGHLIDSTILIDEMHIHKSEHESILAQFKSLEQEYWALAEVEKAQYRLPYLTLRRGILEVEAWLVWCDEVAAALNPREK